MDFRKIYSHSDQCLFALFEQKQKMYRSATWRLLFREMVTGNDLGVPKNLSKKSGSAGNQYLRCSPFENCEYFKISLATTMKSRFSIIEMLHGFCSETFSCLEKLFIAWAQHYSYELHAAQFEMWRNVSCAKEIL